MARVVQEVFTPEAGYPPGLEIDGITGLAVLAGPESNEFCVPADRASTG